MEQIRRVAWYSIVRYVADVIKGEILSVGLVMHVPMTGEFKFQILKENNSKLKSTFLSDLDKKIYKSGINYLEYLLSSIDDNKLEFGMNIGQENFITELKNSELPKGFILTEKRFSKTANFERLYTDILETYIGKKFLHEENGTNTMQVKRKAISLINNKELIDNKIKTNVKIRPVPSISLNYNIDFGYEENNKINLIQAAPDKLVTANEWFQRLNMISGNFVESNRIILLYNSNSESNEDKTVEQMVEYLSSKDERVKSYDIFTANGETGFNQELHHIEINAGDVQRIEDVLNLSA